MTCIRIVYTNTPLQNQGTKKVSDSIVRDIRPEREILEPTHLFSGFANLAELHGFQHDTASKFLHGVQLIHEPVEEQPGPQSDVPNGQGGLSSDRSEDPEFQTLIRSSAFRDIVSDLRQHGERPLDAVTRLLQDNRVLAIGEHHNPDSATRRFGGSPEFIAALRAGNVTHFAIEDYGSPELKNAIAEFNRTGDLEALKSHYPSNVQEHSEYFAMLRNLQAAGIQIVGVDSNVEQTPDPYDTRRNFIMADNIQTILNNPGNRVVFWVGAAHLTGENSVTNILRQRGVSIATIQGVDPVDRSGFSAYPLAEVTRHLDSDRTALSTRSSDALRRFPVSHLRREAHPTGEFDYVFFFR